MKNFIIMALLTMSTSTFASGSLSLFCTSGTAKECALKMEKYLDQEGCRVERLVECSTSSEGLSWCRFETTYCTNPDPLFGGYCSSHSEFPYVQGVKTGFSF